MVISWPNLIEALTYLYSSSVPARIHVKVSWGFDLNKQQGPLLMLDNESDCEVNSFFVVWNGPLWADIIACGRREPIVQNLVIKRVKLRFDGLVVVVQFSSFVSVVPR
jgi:hypothetical protein